MKGYTIYSTRIFLVLLLIFLFVVVCSEKKDLSIDDLKVLIKKIRSENTNFYEGSKK